METENKVKPIVFESACIFSLLGSILGLLFMLFFALFFDEMYRAIGTYTSYGSMQLLSPLYFASLMAAYALSLAGVIKLYRMQRSGLYFYLMAQLMILILPLIWMGPGVLSITNIIFALLFSGIYLYYFRLLN
ncbi:MAG: hypothetical protein ACM3P1_02570 [Candidatus Saccharibacteria bacterium]